jgi:hypothetical protein
VVGLDDEVDVISEDREVHDAEVRPGDHALERGGDHRVAAPAPQVPHVLAGAERRVDGVPRVQLDHPLVRDPGLLSAGPATGAGAGAAPVVPCRQREGELRSTRHRVHVV